MDFKKTNAPTNTVTRDLVNFVKDTNNIYESVVIMITPNAHMALLLSPSMKLRRKLVSSADAPSALTSWPTGRRRPANINMQMRASHT